MILFNMLKNRKSALKEIRSHSFHSRGITYRRTTTCDTARMPGEQDEDPGWDTRLIKVTGSRAPQGLRFY